MKSDSSFTRRDVLRTFAAAAALPGLRPRAVLTRRVGVVGGGMAGVSVAWLLDGACDVVLLEAGNSIGGNVQSLEVELDGHAFVVDIGAQYFHPGPYPLYTALLASLGLYPPAGGESHSFPASITLSAAAEARPRFVSPILPERAWPVLAPWNQAGLEAFAVAFAAAKEREQVDASWALTLEDWFPTLGLSQEQWEGMLLPWAASLFSGSITQARGLSARAAMIFAAKALPDNPLEPLLYYVLNQGMAEALRRMVEQFTTVEVVTGAPVQHVTRELSGGFRIRCEDGRIEIVDDLVFASSGGSTLQLLADVAGTGAQRAALSGIEFHDARLALHTDPVYAPAVPFLWSFLNSRIDGDSCEASMWMQSVLAVPPPATAAKLWKSWVTHRQQQPAAIVHEASFRHMLPTPATLSAQSQLRALQGNGGVWFAGGYTRPYDAQETALRSALAVAVGLGASSARSRALLAVDPTA
jgi:predicted NAD/FAD-binding protein